MADSFDTNLLRLIASELYFSLGMTAAREMFGKSYFGLAPWEKQIVDNTVFGQVSANCKAITPEFLKETLMTQPEKRESPLVQPGFQAPQKTDAEMVTPGATESPQSPPGKK